MKHYQNSDNCMREALSIYPFHILISPSYFDNLYSTFNLQCLFLKMKLQGGRGKKEGGRKSHITVKKDGFSLEQ